MPTFLLQRRDAFPTAKRQKDHVPHRVPAAAGSPVHRADHRRCLHLPPRHYGQPAGTLRRKSDISGGAYRVLARASLCGGPCKVLDCGGGDPRGLSTRGVSLAFVRFSLGAAEQRLGFLSRLIFSSTKDTLLLMYETKRTTEAGRDSSLGPINLYRD
jgi:hypothetical protein